MTYSNRLPVGFSIYFRPGWSKPDCRTHHYAFQFTWQGRTFLRYIYRDIARDNALRYLRYIGTTGIVLIKIKWK